MAHPVLPSLSDSAVDEAVRKPCGPGVSEALTYRNSACSNRWVGT
jgi:hypothetical protein